MKNLTVCNTTHTVGENMTNLKISSLKLYIIQKLTGVWVYSTKRLLVVTKGKSDLYYP